MKIEPDHYTPVRVVDEAGPANLYRPSYPLVHPFTLFFPIRSLYLLPPVHSSASLPFVFVEY